MDLTNTQLMIILYGVLFFYFNSVILYRIFDSVTMAYVLAFVATNLLLFNLLYATQNAKEYLEYIQKQIDDLTLFAGSEPEDGQLEYIIKLVIVIGNQIQTYLGYLFTYILPIIATPFYFSIMIGFRLLGYLLIGPLRALLSFRSIIENLLK